MKDSDRRAVEDADVFQEAVERLRVASMDSSSNGGEGAAANEVLRGKTKNLTVRVAFSTVRRLLSPISFCELPNAEGGNYSGAELVSLLCDNPKRLLELFELNEELLTNDLLEVYEVVDDAWKEEKKKAGPLVSILKSKWAVGLSKRNFLYKNIIANLRDYIERRDEIFTKRDDVFGTLNAKDRQERQLRY